MTYNEWRDELKSNLLCVSEAERRRVLDYYAEAYADRREAGFSEREIIDDFGAPYDAAQRILNETAEEPQRRPHAVEEPRAAEEPHAQTERPSPPPAKKKNGWGFAIFCIIFSIPLLAIVITLVGLTVAFFAVPLGLVAAGATGIGGSIGVMISGDFGYGFLTLGEGFVALGAGIIFFPLFGKLIKIMWKLFNSISRAIKNAFSGKEQAV